MNFSRPSISILLLLCLTFLAPPAHAGTPEAQTLEDLERVGTAIFAWATDQVIPDPPGPKPEGAVTFDVSAVPVITSMDLEALLVPTYLSSLPTLDGWGNAYEFRLDQASLLTLPFTAIRSAGADGLLEGPVYVPGFTATADEDLVFMDGALIQRPLPAPADAPAYTLTVLRQITSAAFSWQVDQVGGESNFPAPNLRTPTRRDSLAGCDNHSVDVSAAPAMTADDLEDLLAPGYLLFLPRLDGWGHSIEFRFDPSPGVNFSDWFAARSPGADDLFEGPIYSAGFTTADTEDIVAFDGFQIQRPELPGQEQVETIGDMQSIGSAIFSWVVDNLALLGEGGLSIDVSTMATITHPQLETLLVPFYLPCLPKRDFWGHDYDFWLDTMNLFASPLTGIRSRGSDDTAEGTVYEPGTFPADATENDLLWVDGLQIRVPDPTLLFLDGFESGDFSAWAETIP